MAGLLNGKGGGKDLSAQATGTNIDCLAQALQMSDQYGRDKLGLKPASGATASMSSNASLQAINDLLADRSYIEGYQPSQADTTVFEAIGKAPS